EVAGLQLGRELQTEERASRLAEARLILGERVEAPHADRAEDAEELKSRDLEQERVAEPHACSSEEPGRVPEEHPDRPDSRQPSWHSRGGGNDAVRSHAGRYLARLH